MHKHEWIRIDRKHAKEPLHFFVKCSDPACAIIRQATIYKGHLKIYTTGTRRKGKSKLFSFRLDLARAEKLRRIGIDIRKVMEEFIDSF